MKRYVVGEHNYEEILEVLTERFDFWYQHLIQTYEDVIINSTFGVDLIPINQIIKKPRFYNRPTFVVASLANAFKTKLEYQNDTSFYRFKNESSFYKCPIIIKLNYSSTDNLFLSIGDIIDIRKFSITIHTKMYEDSDGDCRICKYKFITYPKKIDDMPTLIEERNIEIDELYFSIDERSDELIKEIEQTSQENSPFDKIIPALNDYQWNEDEWESAYYDGNEDVIEEQPLGDDVDFDVTRIIPINANFKNLKGE